MSPMTIFSLAEHCRAWCRREHGTEVRGGGVPGVWDWVGPGGVLYRVLPDTLPGPIFDHIPEISPTHGRMKAISCI